MFSKTLLRGKMLVTWKLRESPRRLMRQGREPAISSPCILIDPLVGAKRPLTRLKRVDLPAPLGPMIAWRSPAGISSETPRMMRVAPKLLRTSSSRSAPSATSGSGPGLFGGEAPGRRDARRYPPPRRISGRDEQHRAYPRPRGGSVHRDPEELHARAGFGLRRAPV